MQPHAVIGAAVGALVMAAILVGLWLAGVVPAPNGLLTGTNNTASLILPSSTRYKPNCRLSRPSKRWRRA